MSRSLYFGIDAATGLIKRAPAQAAVTSSGYQGTQHDQGGSVATDLVLVLNIEAIDIASNDETYDFRIIASNASDRSDGTCIGSIKVGKASALGTGETVDTAAGDRFVVWCRTEKQRVRYRYVDLHLTVAGTTPSVTYNAYLSKDIR